jgi:hypothetical protein
MVPVVLGELYLPLSLRGDEGNIGDNQKKREVLGNCWNNKKSIVVSDMIVLRI